MGFFRRKGGARPWAEIAGPGLPARPLSPQDRGPVLLATFTQDQGPVLLATPPHDSTGMLDASGNSSFRLKRQQASYI